MAVTERQRIARAFDAAAADYDGAAEVQAHISARLAEWLPSRLAVSGAILDAGCGTGRARAALEPLETRHPHIGLDLAPAMARRAAARGTLALAADLECLPLADRSVALYWSSLAWQWCDAARAACEAARVLAPGGELRLATLGPRTLEELREAFAAADGARHVRQFQTLADLQSVLETAGLRDIAVVRETHTAYAPDLPRLLHGIRAIGAHTLDDARRPGLLGKSAWQRVQACYEAHRTPHGLPARYDVFFIRARR